MIQLKYVYRDIKRNYFRYIRNVLQMMLSLIILAYSLQAAITMFDGIRKVDSLRKQNCYRLADTTSESKFEELLNKPGVVKNVAKDIFNYIDLNDITYFVSWNYDNGNIDGNVVKQYTMSQNYVEYFSFDLYSGSLFKNEDYYSENEIVPIIIGNELKEKYKLNKCYTFFDGENNPFNGKVIGILKEGESYVEFNSFSEIKLDYSIISPFNICKISKRDCFSDLDMSLNSLLFISSEDQAKDIIGIVNDSDSYSMELQLIRDYVENIVDVFRPQFMYGLELSGLILFFSIISIISYCHLLIEKNMIEFAVHIHCGAQIKDIISRIILNILFIELIAMLPIFFIFKNSKVTGVVMLLPIIIVMCFVPFAKKKILSINLVQIIRRYG